MLSVSHRRTGQLTSQCFRDSIKLTFADAYQPPVVYVQRISTGIHRHDVPMACDSPAAHTASHVILVETNFGDAQARNEVTFHSPTSI